MIFRVCNAHRCLRYMTTYRLQYYRDCAVPCVRHFQYGMWHISCGSQASLKSQWNYAVSRMKMLHVRDCAVSVITTIYINVVVYVFEDNVNATIDILYYKLQIGQEVPEINCIGDLTIPADKGKEYATVTYPEPATVNANGNNCWPPSGSNFNIGDTTVTCQAWLNGVSARCNFNVFVRGMWNNKIIVCSL